MLLDLDKEDLICLCRGMDVSYSLMDNPVVARNGSYRGSYGRWDWDRSAFQGEDVETLVEVYLVYKNRKENKQ